MDLLPHLARFTLCSVFALAALGKLFRPSAFEKAIAGYHLVPANLVRPTARVLPWVELACAVLLGASLALAQVTWLVIALLTVFGFAMGISLVRGRATECGCGLTGSGKTSWWSVGRNVVLIGLAGIMLAQPASDSPGVSLAALVISTSIVLALSVGPVSVTTFRRTGALHSALRLGGWAS